MGRERIIERERRWAPPAGVVALGATVLIVASFLAQVQIPAEDTTSAQFHAFDSHRGAIATFSLLAAFGFLFMIGPLLYLFRAAQARSPRVRAAMVGFVFIGPVLMAGQAIVNWVAVSEISSDFVEQGPLVREQYPRFVDDLKSNSASIEKVTLYTDSREIDIELKDGSFRTSEYPPDGEQALVDRLDAAGVEHEEDSSGESGDALAEQISEDSTAAQVGGSLQFPALLGLIVAMVYTPLQAVRAGLLARFFGTLGMAVGVSIILLGPPGTLMLALWIGWLGLLFLGRVPGGRPPAWEAGEAIPWLKPGEEPSGEAPPSGEAIEGEATEVPAAAEQPEGPPAGQAGSRKRKRKRRH
ncbi:MAG: hypothetical protein AABM66_02615 [Actinomycetota bacterium]